MVVCSPVDAAGRPGARGYIRPDRTVTLSTERPEDRSFAGRYHVLIGPPPQKKRGEDAPEPPPLIDPKYHQFDTSGLTFEVTPEKHHFDVTVAKPDARPRR